MLVAKRLGREAMRGLLGQAKEGVLCVWNSTRGGYLLKHLSGIHFNTPLMGVNAKLDTRIVVCPFEGEADDTRQEDD